MKKFIVKYADVFLILLAVLLIVIIGLLIGNNAFASYDNNHCEDWKKNCITPTPKPTVIPTPTIDPCLGNFDLKAEFVHVCITPTVTLTPSATPEATPTSTPSTGSTGGGQTSPALAPAAVTCNIPFSAPVLISFKADGNGSVTFGWMESEIGIDKFSIIYGYSPDSLVYGQDNIPAQSREIQLNLLKPGQNVFAQVWGWKNGCSEASNILDPKVR